MQSFKRARWEVAEVDEREVLRFSRLLDVAAPVARILAARGMHDAAEAREFLSPSIARHLHDPAEMFGMEAAVARLRLAISKGEHVRVVSDYDVDGTTASVILQHTLKILGASERVSYHIPSRFDEGYGEFVLPYAEVQRSTNPAGMLLEFFQAAYDSAADLARWDRTALEREPVAP